VNVCVSNIDWLFLRSSQAFFTHTKTSSDSVIGPIINRHFQYKAYSDSDSYCVHWISIDRFRDLELARVHGRLFISAQFESEFVFALYWKCQIHVSSNKRLCYPCCNIFVVVFEDRPRINRLSSLFMSDDSVDVYKCMFLTIHHILNLRNECDFVRRL
jgi:hypothetical protein